MSITINGLDVSSLRYQQAWNGAWTADVDLMPSALDAPLPTGRVVVASSEGISLVGTVDDSNSGTFGDRRHLRIIAGGAGWSKKVRAQHYISSIGVPLLEVATTTAAEVGEVVTVLVNPVLGLDYLRNSDDSAAQIFATAGVDWWVGLDGVTKIGLRPQSAPPADFRVLDWDPSASTMSFTSPTLIEPGTLIADSDGRFEPRVVSQVDATATNGSVAGTIWVAPSAPATSSTGVVYDAIGRIATESTRARYSRFYEYRVVAMKGEQVELQATKPTDGMPDTLPVSVWGGASGYKAKLAPSSTVLLGFRGADPSRPFIAFYEPPDNDGWRPIELDLDATGLISIGAEAATVKIGAGTAPVALMTPMFVTWIAAISAYVNGLAPGTAAPPTDAASTKAVSS